LHRVKPYLVFLGYVILVYIATWTILFAIGGIEFRYYLWYLYLAWTGPGEIPAILQIYTIIFSVIEIAIIYLLLTIVGYYRNKLGGR
jgi:hypothetical protein